MLGVAAGALHSEAISVTLGLALEREAEIPLEMAFS
jgi:hypothetical protein